MFPKNTVEISEYRSCIITNNTFLQPLGDLRGEISINTVEKLISVIIPVYNVETYLEQCIRSVVGQTYQSLEIILVDDGSPDRCGAICDEWRKKDERIKVIHKSNGGLSDARNYGLDIAQGTYIVFIDSDDLVDLTMIERLYVASQKQEADIVECNYSCFTDILPEKETRETDSTTVYTSEEALSLLLDESVFKYTVWNKLYQRGIFDTLRFEVGKLHEDIFFTYQAFGTSKRIIKIDDCLYYYRQRSGSIMGSDFSIRNLDSMEARKRQYYYMKENYPELSGKAQSQLMGNCLYFGQKAVLCLAPEEREDALQIILDVYDEIYNSQPIHESKKQKFWYDLAKWNLRFCCKIRNWLKIGL